MYHIKIANIHVCVYFFAAFLSWYRVCYRLPGLYFLLEHFCPISDFEEFPLQRKIIKSHGECSFTIDNDLRGRMDILALQIQMLITK